MWPALGGVEGCEQSALSRAPFRTESAETDGKKGSMPPAKERHELAHVVQLSGRDFSFHTGIAMEPGRVVALWKTRPVLYGYGASGQSTRPRRPESVS